jgi:hypothetical protein
MMALAATAATVQAACGAAPAASSDGALRLKSAGSWTTVSALVTPSAGDMVYDTTNNVLSVCNGTTWTSASGGGGGSTPTDRISATDNYSMVVANPNPGTVSFTLGNTAGAAYLHPTLGFVGPGVSTTGGISGTTGYFSGNVGIGTTAPGTPLELSQAAGTATASLLTLRNQNFSVGDMASILFNHNTNNYYYAAIQSYLPGGNLVDLQFITQSAVATRSTAMTIKGTGNVGIGTVTPTATLQVSGTFTVSSTVTNANPALYVSTSGNVGIGTSSPVGALHVVGTDPAATGKGLVMFDGTARVSVQLNAASGFNQLVAKDSGSSLPFYLTNSNGPLVFRADSSAEVMRLTGGNVGIGTTAPSGTLHISGTAFMTRYSGQPVACSANYNGLLAMTSTARLCACDGSSWKYADGTGNACAW